MQDIEQLTVNTIRALCIDMIDKANSGHPGMPLGAAPMAFTLWSKHLKHNPRNSKWIDRDRFVLSAGHGSSLLYSLLHLFGYNLSLNDLKEFRQYNSKTPGHPELGETDGVETSTGPLGQGIANAVGMAIAESHLAEKFNKDAYKICDHYTYALAGDGCLMEGVSGEASSLAGTLGLSKLIVLYDSNNITIEGSTDIAFRENVIKRYEAYDWQTILVEDGNDINAIDKAISEAKADKQRPSLIEIKTKIGFASPKHEGKSSSHGSPLGKDESLLTKIALNISEEEFFVPDEIRNYFSDYQKKAELLEIRSNENYLLYKKEYPELAKEWEFYNSGKLADDVFRADEYWTSDAELASRQSSSNLLNQIEKFIPNLIGGSADLAPSNLSTMLDRDGFSKENRLGTNMSFGVREFAMAAISSGIALHGGLKPYTAGFLIFSDYMKSGLRMQALMNLPVINIFTHDSIAVGEDGPTHQPIEQLPMLRSINNFTVLRPCDAKELAAAWYLALNNNKGPTALILSRQKLNSIKESGKRALKGAYILKDTARNIDVILIASGSEVELIHKAADLLKNDGINSRVVSMMSWEVFEEQDDEYKEQVLPKSIKARLAVEAASSFGWERYTGLDGDIISVDKYSSSASGDVLMDKHGFTVEHVVERVKNLLY